MTDPQPGAAPSFLDSLGERGRRRAEPRTSISLAGAGCVLAIVGVLALAGDTGLEDDGRDFSRVPGVLLSALVTALGYFILTTARRGSVATAGAVAAALGVPSFMFFVTFNATGLPPYDPEGILVVSTAVWLGSYLIGPAKGRPFFLGGGLIALWFTVLELTEGVFELPGGPFIWSISGISGSQTFDGTGDVVDPSTGEIIAPGSGFEELAYDPPDPATIGILSLVLGAMFLFVGRWLDRGGRHGAATPFAFAALPCLAVGVIGLAPDLEAAGTGLLLVGIGLALAHHGATIRRRATSWIGGSAMALGLALFLGDNASGNITTAGMLYIAGGVAMVFIGHLIASATSEPDELTVTGGGPVDEAPRRVLVADTATTDADDTGAADPHAPWKPPIPPPG